MKIIIIDFNKWVKNIKIIKLMIFILNIFFVVIMPKEKPVLKMDAFISVDITRYYLPLTG